MQRHLWYITAPPGQTPNARHDGTISACPGCPKPVVIGSYCSLHPQCCVSVSSLDISMGFHIDISGRMLLAVAKHHATLDKHSVFPSTVGQVLPHGPRFEHHISTLVHSKARAFPSSGYTRRIRNLSSWNNIRSLNVLFQRASFRFSGLSQQEFLYFSRILRVPCLPWRKA